VVREVFCMVSNISKHYRTQGIHKGNRKEFMRQRAFQMIGIFHWLATYKCPFNVKCTYYPNYLTGR